MSTTVSYFTVRGLPTSVEDRRWVLDRLFRRLQYEVIAHEPRGRVVAVRHGEGDPVDRGYAAERDLTVIEGWGEAAV